MATNPFEGYRSRKGRGQFKIPSSGGNPFQSLQNQVAMLSLKDMISQEKQGQLQQQLGANAVPVGGRDPVTGAEYKTPEAIKVEAETKGEIKRQQTIAEKTPERMQLIENLKRMKALFDQVQRPESGFNRYIGKGKNYLEMKTQTGSGIFSDQFEDLKKAIAGNVVRIIGGETGARLSDFDIQRVLGVNPDILGDTADRGRLGWATYSDMIDDALVSYGAKKEGVAEKILDKPNLSRARLLQGTYKVEDFDDESLVGIAEVDDVKSLPSSSRERLYKELKIRGLI